MVFEDNLTRAGIPNTARMSASSDLIPAAWNFSLTVMESDAAQMEINPIAR